MIMEAVLRDTGLQRDQPNLTVEIEERHNADSISRVFQHMAALGYSASILEGDRLYQVAACRLRRSVVRQLLLVPYKG
jgi:hypothetical protein